MSDLKSFIKKVGGNSVVARQCEVSRSAISHWIKRGAIPAKQALSILTLAAEKDIQLSPKEFLEEFTKSKVSSENLSNNDKM